MKCRSCGAEAGDGASYCPSCGRPMTAQPPGEIDRMADDAAKAAHDLVRAAANFSSAVLKKVDKVAHDPPGTAHHAIDKVKAELKAAKAGIDKALKDLE